MNNILRVISIDIGSKNFCFYVEEFDKKHLNDIKNIPELKRYNPNGTPTSDMNKILNKIYMNGNTLLHENVDLTTGCKKGKYLDTAVLHNLTNLLDKYSDIFDTCSIVVVEEQMAFRGKVNTKAIKIGQHCQSYFMFKYGKFKEVIEFPSYHKTHVLGSEKLEKGTTKKGKTKYKNIDKPARKKWSIEKAKEILTIRGETDHVLLTAKRGIKKDDIADTITMLAAFKYLRFVDKKI